MKGLVGNIITVCITAVLAVYVLVDCSGVSDVAGGGIDVGNPGITASISGTALNEETGETVPGAFVYIRRADYVKDVSDTSIAEAPDAVTDSMGNFVVDSLDTGAYTVEIGGVSGYGAFLEINIDQQGEKYNADEVSLNPTSSINGYVNFASYPSQDIYVCITGLGRIAKVDTSTGSYSFEEIPPGNYDLKIFTDTTVYPPVEISDVSVSNDNPALVDTVVVLSAEDEDYSLWGSSADILINTSTEGAGITEDLFGFPLLLRLDGGNFDFTQAQSSGEDVRFAKSDGSPVTYEIERWDASGEKAEIWVLMDTVYGDNSTQNFIMYWGNPDAQDRSQSSGVFDTANAFAAVWHMDSSEDATVNGNHAEDVNTSTLDGVAGYAKEFNGTDSYMACGNDSSILNITEEITVSCWLKTTMPPSSLISILRHDEHFTALQLTGDSSTAWTGLWFEGEALLVYFPWEGVLNDGLWHNFTVTYDAAAGPKVYIDGTLRFSNSGITGELVNISSVDFMIGATENNTEHYDGLLDEVRVNAGIRNSSWIKMCYENQKAGSGVVSLVK